MLQRKRILSGGFGLHSDVEPEARATPSHSGAICRISMRIDEIRKGRCRDINNAVVEIEQNIPFTGEEHGAIWQRFNLPGGIAELRKIHAETPQQPDPVSAYTRGWSVV